MRKKQLIQLLQFVFLWLMLWLFVVFVLRESFVGFVLDYRLYLLVVSVSYFYYYSIQYALDKKYELIRNVLICGNVYLFLHLFFRPLLNISHQLFVLLGLIFLGLWRSSRLKTRWKYLMQIIGGIFIFFILISGMFYYYPESPDIEGFLKSRRNEIMVLGITNPVDKRDAYIKITSFNGSEDFDIRPNFSKVLSEDVEISYPSSKKQRDEKVVVILPQGDLVWLFPQSEVQIIFEGENLKKIEKLSGRIGFLSGVFESNLEILGFEENLSSQELDWLESRKEIYKYELLLYLKDQISESNIGRANNTIMYDIDGTIVKFLAKVFPVTFGKNLRNYNEFQKYFERIEDDEIDLHRYEMRQSTGESMYSLWGDIKDNMDIGKNNIYGWFRKPERK